MGEKKDQPILVFNWQRSFFVVDEKYNIVCLQKNVVNFLVSHTVYCRALAKELSYTVVPLLTSHSIIDQTVSTLLIRLF